MADVRGNLRPVTRKLARDGELLARMVEPIPGQVTVAEAAHRLGLPIIQIRDLVLSGRLPAVPTTVPRNCGLVLPAEGKLLLVAVSELAAFVAENISPGAAATAAL